MRPTRLLTVAILPLALGAAPLAAAADGAVSSGEQTVAHVCSVCHEQGLLGAPQIGDASAWKARLDRAGSVDRLAESAANGRGNMPPRGGQPGLSNDDLKAAIRYMLSLSGA